MNAVAALHHYDATVAAVQSRYEAVPSTATAEAQ
jgi:hypothetical protein